MAGRVAPRNYYDEGSGLYADPTLQYPRDIVVDTISEQVGEVDDVKRENFNPKADGKRNYILLAAAVALAALSVVAFIAANAATGGTVASLIGLGTAMAALSAVVLGMFLYNRSNITEREQKEQLVKDVHRDAKRLRIGKTIDTFQKQDIEMGQIAHRGRNQRVRRPAADEYLAPEAAAGGERRRHRI